MFDICVICCPDKYHLDELHHDLIFNVQPFPRYSSGRPQDSNQENIRQALLSWIKKVVKLLSAKGGGFEVEDYLVIIMNKAAYVSPFRNKAPESPTPCKALGSAASSRPRTSSRGLLGSTCPSIFKREVSLMILAVLSTCIISPHCDNLFVQFVEILCSNILITSPSPSCNQNEKICQEQLLRGGGA